LSKKAIENISEGERKYQLAENSEERKWRQFFSQSGGERYLAIEGGEMAWTWKTRQSQEPDGAGVNIRDEGRATKREEKEEKKGKSLMKINKIYLA